MNIKYQKGDSSILMLIFIMLVVGFFYMDELVTNKPVPQSEILSAMELSKNDIRVQNELNEFLLKNPSPNVTEFKELNSLISAIAIRNKNISDDVPIKQNYIDSYFENKSIKEQKLIVGTNKEKAMIERLEKTTFFNLQAEDKVNWLFYGSGKSILYGVTCFLLLCFIWIFVRGWLSRNDY